MREETTTESMVGWGRSLFGGGVVLLFTPLWACGVVLCVVGWVLWSLAPANHTATQHMVDHAAEPSGCGWGCVSVLGAVVIVAIAGGAALAALAIIEGGMHP